MRFISLLTATVIPSIVGVFSTPAIPRSIHKIQRDHEHDVERSVNLVSTLPSRATEQPWVCIAFSPSTTQYGIAHGQSQSAVLDSARKICPGNCKSSLCNQGCIAIAVGRLKEPSVARASTLSGAEGLALYYCGLEGSGSNTDCNITGFGCSNS